MMDAASWNPQDPALAPNHDEEFQQFLDLGGMSNLSDAMPFDFNDYQTGSGTGIMHQPGREQIDTQMGGTDTSMLMGATTSAMQAQLINMTTAAAHPAIQTQMIPPSTSTDAITEIDAQIQYLQQQRMQQQHRQIQEQQVAYYASQTHAVPPTPQSLEMPPASNQFYSNDQSQTPMFGSRYQRMKEQQDMAFTPLVSPAVTPLDPHFQMEAGGFTIPGAYFSPLTSPALHAQSDQGLLYDRRSSLSNHNSPAEMDIETTTTQQPVVDLSKKARKTNASRAKAKSSVRQSPISKPQRKRATPTPKMVSQALSEMREVNEDGLDQMLPSTALPAPMSSEESENASVSPENLSDMPPPPLPQQKQSSKSPFIQPQPQPQPHPAIPAHVQGKPSPATPASLMKLPASSANNSASSNPLDLGPSDHIESFELPESVNFSSSKTKPPRLDTSTPTQSPLDPGTATGSSFQPLPSPVFAKPTAAASASASPNLAPGSSGPSARKTPKLLARGSQSKRGSVSSVHVSPALRPRISPSIKPLLPGTPGGMSAEDTASRLLMSKSNYQNILEGNTVPGVTYPSELSTNLTSKRTSHKIAEQGRRNRINSALQEIATLLPQPPKESKSESEERKEREKEAKAGGAPNSKASTVELAIEYIKQLKQEVADATKRAEEAEKKLELKEKSLEQKEAVES
ncbi:helix-loop-helix DNA-binding domain-containing protein [Colletotrichum scovillei]|uniref:Phosphorus acquisition-controlling protein n=1 Tax=Colletotrichum scovillei TaxID=1209932 RepID=A0A9P7R602_9PEZI|nr:helix-loop-helix DNA-binding domain-containing protein [Colletotrichum scovillei]KAF4781681.1 helix-loop-helix DNA-binding domain-containing protein [Colletotrichum scovillei]KAG7050845.1 phosphorus acquisition-controlling protein [Colletotrichum scovillei]KAG7069886.1 phosphorus acquisition-controlling protein [Colletotrichum scovillei]KAG7073849.1 phosphorus acquisition-controlling protein [Colletotrichum scovillei]